IPASDRVKDLVSLGGHHLAATLGGFPKAGQVAPRRVREQPVRKLLLDRILRKELEAVFRVPALYGLEVAASKSEVVGLGRHRASSGSLIGSHIRSAGPSIRA